MKVTYQDVHKVFKDLLNEELSREEAYAWVLKMISADDDDLLKYYPSNQEDAMYVAFLNLLGVDLEITPHEYLHSFEDIEDWYFQFLQTDS